MAEFPPVRVRFAPSPTGRMHLGSARTALYNFLLAQRTGGKFILRVEDTDFKRTVPGAEEELINALHWLGIQWDEGPDVGGPYGPYRQSERKDIYLHYARQLIDNGSAYPCFCTSERLARIRQERVKRKESINYDGFCRHIDPDEAARRIASGAKYVIRFKSPQEGITTVFDLLRGKIVVDNHQIDDFVLVKSDGWALYHLAALVDDHLMKITHVFRSSEWLPTFPLHSLVIRAFGWDEPKWIHLSVFLKPSGKGKMSKRELEHASQDGYSIFVKDLEELGYIPEGILNWIVLMGWGVAEDDVMSIKDMIERFDINHLNPSAASINFSKLDHFNGTHIRMLSNHDLTNRIKPFFIRAGYNVNDEQLSRIVPIIRERLVTLDDALSFAGFFFNDAISPAPEELIGNNMSIVESLKVARRANEMLSGLSDITPELAESPLRDLVNEMGLKAGQIFGILRVAITGQAISPPLFESMAIIGKEKVLQRLQNAISILEKMVN